ncbi:MAG: hypothetical protein ACKV2T_20325 [Kofleriaceae bacterium]
MLRRRIVVAFVLSAAAVVAWRIVLSERAPASGDHIASIDLAPATPQAPPPDPAVLNVLDGAILDLGDGIEVTIPSYFALEKVPGYPRSVSFMDAGRMIRGAVLAVPATRKRRHADPLDSARELAKDQKTRITHYENTPDGAYVIYDGFFERMKMRQHLIQKRSAKGRVSAWVILLDTGIDHPENLALVEELRSGGRLVAR